MLHVMGRLVLVRSLGFAGLIFECTIRIRQIFRISQRPDSSFFDNGFRYRIRSERLILAKR